jgi:hypothetical protein
MSEDLDQENFSTSEDSKIKPPTLYLLQSRNLELFALSSDSKPVSLDEGLEKSMELKGELFPLSKIVQGQKRKDRKIQKVQDLKPIAFVRFNTRQGKTKAVTLRALLDSGGSGSLVTH